MLGQSRAKSGDGAVILGDALERGGEYKEDEELNDEEEEEEEEEWRKRVLADVGGWEGNEIRCIVPPSHPPPSTQLPPSTASAAPPAPCTK